uniref:Uncharacterized protein n=1 Tax=Anopheles christyi TaxID=43041 RepID=A0A182KHG4_9DIPT
MVQDRVVKIRKEVQISESTNLTKLIELYHQQQQQQQRPDKLSVVRAKQAPHGGSDDHQLSYQVQSEQQPGSDSDGPRLNTDEDDGSDDYEQSGNYELYSNHTTIQLDADETDQQ